jgi:hypothetical protein
MQISKQQLDALHKKVADAKRTAVAAKDTLRCESGRVYQEHDTETRRLRALIQTRDVTIVQLGIRLAAYGDPKADVDVFQRGVGGRRRFRYRLEPARAPGPAVQTGLFEEGNA